MVCSPAPIYGKYLTGAGASFYSPPLHSVAECLADLQAGLCSAVYYDAFTLRHQINVAPALADFEVFEGEVQLSIAAAFPLGTPALRRAVDLALTSLQMGSHTAYLSM